MKNNLDLLKKELTEAFSIQALRIDNLIEQFTVDLPKARKLLIVKLWTDGTMYYATVNWHPDVPAANYPGTRDFTLSHSIEETIKKLASLFKGYTGGGNIALYDDY